MKHIATLTSLLLIAITTPALALQGSECSARSQKLPLAERADFMKSCLEQAESPANVQEEERKRKSGLCEQNAKNKKLQGNDKSNYITSCMNKNEAAAMAGTQPRSAAAPSHKPAPASSARSAPHKPAKKPHDKRTKKNAKQAADK